MAAYAVTDFTTAADSIEAVLAALETQIDLITSTKTLRYVDVIPMPEQGKYMGVIIYDA